MKQAHYTAIKVVLLTFLSGISNLFSIANASSSFNTYADFASKFNLSPWKQYAESLRTCTAGEFILFDPAPVAAMVTAVDTANQFNIRVPTDWIDRGLSECKLSFKIFGMHNNKCKVVITDLATGHQTMPLECFFDQNEQAILAKRAEGYANDPHSILPNPLAEQATIRSCNPRS